MTTEKKNYNNILKFPGTKNPQLEDQQKEIIKLTSSIAAKMSDNNWESFPITHKELSILSNHGETIEFAPLTAARLNSILATSLIRNTFMEDFIWVEKKE